jgi:hypothetical protein
MENIKSFESFTNEGLKSKIATGAVALSTLMPMSGKSQDKDGDKTEDKKEQVYTATRIGKLKNYNVVYFKRDTKSKFSFYPIFIKLKDTTRTYNVGDTIQVQ